MSKCPPQGEFLLCSEEAHLAALRQVAQGAHLTQTVQDALTDAGGLLQLFHRDIFLSVDGHPLQRVGSSTAQTLQLSLINI